MAVFLDTSRASRNHAAIAQSPRARAALRLAERSHPSLHIGLVNNMPDAAFRATERQFISLLESASDEIPIRLSLFSLPGIERAGACLHHAEAFYSSVDSLGDTKLDGIIVTGREPTAADLHDEPYWKSFTELLEWARSNTRSAAWSCLAAHAAVLYMDNIARRRSQVKDFGVPMCTRISRHPLMAGAPACFPVPHSRWNGLDEKDLAASGYVTLSRTADGSVDTFVKEESSLFVFFQGHPEYETDTLLREYRRDIARYLKRECESYPPLPASYFDPAIEAMLLEFKVRAMQQGDEGLLDTLDSAFKNLQIENTWRLSAVRVYRNWLEIVSARKSPIEMERPEQLLVRARG
jgi:homoserine O-succinyltransferase